MTRTWILEHLRTHLCPTFLEVIDESALHAGHLERHAGRSETHFRIRIQSPLLEGQTRLTQHRRIYDLLQIEKMQIHAITIEILP